MQRISIVALYFVVAAAILMRFIVRPFGPWWAGAVGAIIIVAGFLIWKGLSRK